MKIWDEVLKSWLGKFWDKDLKSVSRNMWDEDLKKEISWKESRHKAQRPKKKKCPPKKSQNKSAPICKIQSHIETSPCKRMCSIYRSHVPCWFFGARLNLSSTKSIVLTSSRCLQRLDGWKNAELPLCNHGLGFGNPSKRSLFLNRLDQNSDLSDFFLMEYTYIYMYILQIAIKWPKKKSPDSIRSPSFSHQVMKLRRIACVRAWPITCATPGGVVNCSRR